MMAKHPIGFNVRPGVDYTKLLAQVKKMGGCRAMLFHEYASSLHRLQAFTPYVDTIIWRPEGYNAQRLYINVAEPERWVHDRVVEMHAAGMDMYLHLHNESEWNGGMIDWERRAIQYGALKGTRFVALNQGVGNPHETRVHLSRPILSLAAQYPKQVLIGIHDGYFSVTGDRKYPWYLGRWQADSADLNGGHSFESYRKTQGLGPVSYVITEAGAEDIADDHPFTDTLPKQDGHRPGPVHRNESAWRHIYGPAYVGKDEQYLAEIQTAYRVGKWDDPRIAGVCLFTWGS